MTSQVDYSLYLVTDSTEAILGKRDLVQVVRQALDGGATIVQYRDKTSDTGHLIHTAKALHEACQSHNIPLLINDRVDVALAVGCEGVHIGQDDMDVRAARNILGSSKIIGVTVSSLEEAGRAVDGGADYLGIGTLYATNTKKNTKDIIGINGVRRILRYLETRGDEASRKVKTVVIGGVNASNLQLIKHQLNAPTLPSWNPKTIDGVAVVSAIIAAPDPSSAAKHLKDLWTTAPFSPPSQNVSHPRSPEHLKQQVNHCLSRVHQSTPLTHNMTNTVVQHLSASIALAIGASPIMSSNGLEAADLAKLNGGLLINMGTSTPDSLANMRMAIQAYNTAGGPVILDPVGAGATSTRKQTLRALMSTGYFAVIKGNEREILEVARASGFNVNLSPHRHQRQNRDGDADMREETNQHQQQGVDSGASVLRPEEKAYLVTALAARERNIVVLTGETDYVSDGVSTFGISNGHPYLGLMTGSGCSLGTTISAYLAANKMEDRLSVVVAALCHYEIAAEDAASRDDVKGPGSFVSAFVDELYGRRMDVAEGRAGWIGRAKVIDLTGFVGDEEESGFLRLA